MLRLNGQLYSLYFNSDWSIPETMPVWRPTIRSVKDKFTYLLNLTVTADDACTIT